MADKRLIDANALLEKIQYRLPHKDKIAELINECVEITRKEIANAPTVDAVEVVRCKDCKHSSGTRIDPNTCVCFKHGQIMLANHFCSWGERRSENG